MMIPEPDYINTNKELWNKKTEVHVHSRFYDLEGFLKGKSSLNDIELALLGDVAGKTVLHLQCHFGLDTLSLARLGARPTGVDFSDKAISKAGELAEALHLDARFVCCNIYDLPAHLEEKFDIVFTSYGTIGWLPDLRQWAALIARYLKPGGKFILVEFHPVVWMFDDDFSRVAYSYFNKETIVETVAQTYADQAVVPPAESFSWNHPLSEVFGALALNGLRVEDFREYDYSPYDCFRHTEQVGERKYVIRHLGDKIPMVYSVVAVAGAGG